MKIHLGKVVTELYNQYLQKAEDILKNHLEGKTVRAYFGWFTPRHEQGLLTLKVDEVKFSGGDITVKSGSSTYFLYCEEEIEILD